MKKILFLMLALPLIAAAQAPKQPLKNTKTIQTAPQREITGLTVVSKKNGVSIVVLEGCRTATTIEQFSTNPNAGSTKTDAIAYKGLDASIADCCARSKDANFVLRISYVDCNGNAIANRRPYEAVTRCNATAKDLMPTIMQQIGANDAHGSPLYLKNIKVWQE
jgi:uncharacterized lipoprotein YajG